MNWFLMLWPMAAAASLTLALVHFGRWLGQRDERANLLFSVAATATASVALIEMMLARAESTAQYATLVRWCFAPLWVQLVSLILFVREYFGVGRRWLALSSVGLWTLTVIINFLPGQNLVYKAMTGLRPVEIGGATFVVGEGIANPWNAVNYLGTLLMLAFVVDASISLWRQGGRRKALVVGGGVTFFYLVAGVHSALIEAGLIQSPYVISFSFLAIVAAMSSELNGDLWRAAQVRRQLQQSEAETLRQREELAHLNRVSTMGELTTSLAHELNQPLGAILRNAESAEMLLQADVPDLEELRAIVADIRKDDERAGNVIDRLRTLLKRRDLELQTVDLVRMVNEVVALVRFDATARRVRLETDLPGDLPPVRGDRVHLQQVLLNLIMNGMDAMHNAQDGDRRVLIRARRAGDRLIEVAVSDSGPGIPPDAISRIFEPFFTTKASGMGMGLTISRSIIEAHAGRIWAENNASRGATFTFTLTVARGEGRGTNAGEMQ